VQSVAGGGALVFAGQMLGKGLRLVFRLGASWLLTTSTYGLFVLALSMAELVGRIGTLGFDRAALRFGAEDRGRGDLGALARSNRFSLVVSVVAGVVAGSAMYAFSGQIAAVFSKPDLAHAIELVAAAVPAVSVALTAAAGLQAAQRMRAYALVSFVIPSGVGVAGLAMAWATDTEEVGACAAFSAGWILAALWGARSAARIASGQAPKAPPRYREMLKFGVIMLSYIGAAQLVSQVDRFMVGGLRGADEVGFYDAAAVIANHVPIFLTALNAVVFPKLGAAHHGGRPDEVRRLYQLETRWVTLLSIPLLLGVVTLGGPLLSLWGEEFAVAATTVSILALAQTLNASAGPVGGVLMMTGHEKWVLANTALLGGLNAVGNYLLVPRFGIIGAAISTACAVVCWNIASLVEVWFLLKVQPYTKAYMKVVAAGVASLGTGVGLLVVLPAWGGWVALPAGLAVYAALCQAFALQPEDRQLVELIRKKLGR
jgi:stage V sporulation protein B